MLKKTSLVALVLGLVLVAGPLHAKGGWEATREFSASTGQTLMLDLKSGGSVKITGWSQSGIVVSYNRGGPDGEHVRVGFEESGHGLKITSQYEGPSGSHSTDVDFEIQVPQWFDIELDSMGGGLELSGVEGNFSGKTMGGSLVLHDVRGKAQLTTMGGQIRLTDSDLDGSLKTMGGEVLFENVIGDVTGSSMGGNVRYKNVQRRSGNLASPARLDDDDAKITAETVQISTMGGAIEVDDAPEGATLHTMGGNIRVSDAARFVSAKTMGGDILIESVDGWVKATTMGGDVMVTVVGQGGDVRLKSLSGDITLVVPSGFSMELDLQIAYTRNSSQRYEIVADSIELQRSETSEWDYDNGSPRRYIRAKGSSGGANRVSVETINGNITVTEGR
jgi:DUF4097 and DUF4098 domain-containing protein YvlB